MSEITQSWFDEKLARFARGEVGLDEARELAQASLESHAWFEDLTATALAKTAVSSVPVPAAPLRHARWRSPFLLATAAAIVIGIFVVNYAMRVSSKQRDSARIASLQPPSMYRPSPILAFAPGSAQPVLLAEGLQLATPARTTQVFRGNQSSRSPRQTGAIILVEDGQATINLGSVDGLAKGSEVEVYRDNTLKHPAGTLLVGTLFREQARADVGPKDLKVKYVVQVTDGDHLQALIQQATASEARGDLTEARRAAASAIKWANNATVTTSQKASAAELLARLDFTAKDLAGAEMHYRAALDLLSADQHVSQNDLAEVQNDLAALAMLRGDYNSADKLLRGNPPIPTKPNLRAERLNNLGVLAETRGDRTQAESFYTQALAILPQDLPNERRVAEANLARVKGLH